MYPNLNFVVLDLETQRYHSEVAGGWANPQGFGLSVGCTWDAARKFQLWYEKDAGSLIEYLGQFPAIVGFNIIDFDFGVLEGYASTLHLHRRTVDILKEVKRHLGHRLKLETLAEATLGTRKSGDGLKAIAWWRQGLKDKVAEYCKHDVAITRDLFLYGMEHGKLKYWHYGEIATVAFSLPSGAERV